MLDIVQQLTHTHIYKQLVTRNYFMATFLFFIGQVATKNEEKNKRK